MDKYKSLYGDEIYRFIPYVKKFLDDRIKSSYKVIDIYPYIAAIDLVTYKAKEFIRIMPGYFFHIKTGFIVHIRDKNFYINMNKKQLSIMPILKRMKIEPGRFLLLGRRIIKGPKGGKYRLIATFTHISTNPKIIKNRKTRIALQKAKMFVRRYKLVYPDYYKVLRMYRNVPMKKLIKVIYNTPFAF